MDSSTWDAVVADLDSKDVAVAVAAASRLHSEAIADDIPRLLSLLKAGNDFFVREAAAWPLAELSGPTVLRQLLIAYQRGFDEGHDNDGFTAALLEIATLHPAEAKLALERLATSETACVREHAEWLMAFCE